MKALIARELRGLTIHGIIAAIVVLTCVFLKYCDFDSWRLNFMSVTVRPHLLMGLLGLWTVVCVEHIFGRESGRQGRRSLALLPVSLNQVFLAKLVAAALSIIAMTVCVALLDLIAGELFPIPEFDRIAAAITATDFACFTAFMAASILFFSIVIKGSGGSLAAAALLLGAAHAAFSVFWGTFLDHWEAPSSSADALLKVAQLTSALALLVGGRSAFVRGQLHRGLRLRPLLVALPAMALMLCPSIAWGGYELAQLIDFSFERENVSLEVGEVFDTRHGTRVVVYACRDDHHFVKRTLMLDPDRRELFDIGINQYPHALDHSGDAIIVFDGTWSREDAESYAVGPDARRKDMPRNKMILSRDFKLRPRPVSEGKTCSIAYDGSQRCLVIEKDGEILNTMAGPSEAAYVFDNKIWTVETIDKKVRPWQKKLVCFDPFAGTRREYPIPDVVDLDDTKSSFMRPATVVGAGQVVASGGQGEIIHFDLLKNSQRVIVAPEAESRLTTLVATWDGSYVFVQRMKKRDGHLGVLDVSSAAFEYLPEGHHVFLHPAVGVIGLSPDGQYCVGQGQGPFSFKLSEGVSSIKRFGYSIQGIAPAWTGPHHFVVGHGKKILTVDVISGAVETLLDVSR